MELKDFVSQTLLQIIEGIKLAQDQAGELGAAINPTGLAIYGQHEERPFDHETGNVSQIIEFEIAVTAQEGTKDKAGIGVLTGIISGGFQGESEKQSLAVNKIKFGVPVLFPGHQVREIEEEGPGVYASSF